MIIHDDRISGFEPFFGNYVTIAFINHEAKTIRPTSGYFPPHKHGKATKKYAKQLGYEYNDR